MAHWTTYMPLLIAGLAGSLHCIGMCGPILVGFSQVFGNAQLTREGRSMAPTSRRHGAVLDFTCYHIGRIWTYAMLGFLAGWAGQGVRGGGDYLGWQKPVSIAVGAAVIGTGLLLLNVVPGLKLDVLLTGCASSRFAGRRWFDTLLRTHGVTARLLLGVIMGLLPCGLVYAMLVLVAAMPSPLHSAVGMIVFGIATIPSLTAVLLTVRLLPAWMRVHGTRIAAAVIIATGAWMTARAVMGDPVSGSCPHCAQP